MKNIAIDILEHEERKKDNREWFNEDVDSWWRKRISHTEAYLARPVRAKRVEYGDEKGGLGMHSM
jgi:hypothetical protein